VNVRDPKPSRVRLERDEVHLWWGRGDAVEDVDGLRGWLSDEERGRAERFRHAADARAFVFRRAFLRSVLTRYAGLAPAELRFGRGEFGKPFLAGTPACVRFNSSSSAGWVLVVVSAERELGVDVERADQRFLAPEELSHLARRVLTSEEQAALARLPGEQRPCAFLRLWTRKEALLKALGTGLSREPNTVELGLEPFAGERVLDVRLFPGRALDLQAPPGFSASAVVAAEPGERLRWFTLGPPGSSLALLPSVRPTE
jgi:4'-phosphopantetheinyl transferase